MTDGVDQLKSLDSSHVGWDSGEGDVSGVVTVEDGFDDQLRVDLLSYTEASEPSDNVLEDEVSDGELIELAGISWPREKGGTEGIRLGNRAIFRRRTGVGISVVIGESGLGDLNTCKAGAVASTGLKVI